MTPLRLALRRLIRRPQTTTTAVLALALGIGLATTLFAVLRGVMLRGLPVEGAERVMFVGQVERAFESGGMGTAAADFAVWQEAQRSFEDLGAYQAFYTFVTPENGETATWIGASATPETFKVLRVQPQLGRLFAAADTEKGAPPVVLIGHKVWQQQFGGDAEVLGKVLKVNRKDATVVGVMPEGFGFPYRQHIWMPFKVYPETPKMTVFAIGRLGEGVSREAAREELQALSNHFRAEGPWVDDTMDQPPRVAVEPYLRAITDPTAQRALLVLFLIACAVLMVACANVANLLLAWGAERAGELTVRRALGAQRLQLIVPFLAEIMMLAALGGILGLGLAHAGVRLFRRTLEASNLNAFWVDIRVDHQTMAFVGLAMLLAVLAAGLVPAIRTTRVEMSRVQGGASRVQMGTLGHVLVVAQITVSMALLVVVGIMARTLVDLSRPVAILESDRVLTARLSPWQSEYADAESYRSFFRQVEERLAALPEVERAALSTTLPFGYAAASEFVVEGKNEGAPMPARLVVVSPDYFQAFGLGMLSGRGFEETDGPDAPPVALVNRSFAERHGLSSNLEGKRLRHKEDAWIRIVGQVPDITTGPFDSSDPAAVYLPMAQQKVEFARLVVRTQGDPLALAPALRREIAEIDRLATVYEVQTMATALDRETWSHRMVGLLAMLMGASTLLLAAIGLYAVLAFSVRRRVYEMGVRLALGARGGDLVRMVLGSGLRQVGLGLLLGLLVAVGLGRALQGMLEGVVGWDVLSIVGASVVLVMVGLLAGCGPARWASRVDPMVALRQE